MLVTEKVAHFVTSPYKDKRSDYISIKKIWKQDI